MVSSISRSSSESCARLRSTKSFCHSSRIHPSIHSPPLLFASLAPLSCLRHCTFCPIRDHRRGVFCQPTLVCTIIRKIEVTAHFNTSHTHGRKWYCRTVTRAAWIELVKTTIMTSATRQTHTNSYSFRHTHQAPKRAIAIACAVSTMTVKIKRSVPVVVC